MKNVHKISNLPNEDLIRSKKRYIIKRCPYKGCLAIVDRLTDHLVRKHKVARKSYQLKRLQKRTEGVPSICNVSGRKRQNIKKHIKEEDKIHDVVISSEDEPVQVKKEQIDSKYQKITVNIRFEKKDIIEISSEENSCEENRSEENRCEENRSEENRREENSSEENSSEEHSSGSSMIITEDSGEESAEQEKEYYFQHKEIQQFIRYLQRPPYMKARKDALQHACQVYMVWGVLSKKRKMKELFSRDKLNDWLQEFLKDYAPGTARSYLSSVAMFVGHVVRQGFLRKGLGKALRFKEDIKLLSKQIRRKVKTRRTKLDVEEIETMITPEDFTEFWQSDVASEAEAKLKGEIPHTFQQSDFLHVRNYLLLRLLQSNAQRPGAVRNNTQQSMERAHTDTNGAVVMIAEHKTGAQGTVNLGMSHDIFNMVLSYIQWTTKITGFQLDPTHPIFITVPIDQQFSVMTTNLINKAIQNIWKKGPVNQKCITATRIRKSTATYVRLADPTSRESLAAHMTHSPQTADRHYNMINQRNNAMMVTNLIATLIQLQPKPLATAYIGPSLQIEMEKKETPMDKINEEDFDRDEKDKEIDLEATTFDGEEDSQKDDEDYREVNDDILDSNRIDEDYREVNDDILEKDTTSVAGQNTAGNL
ncbi:Hypothetical predicted protein [Mytilus galloprovincialis]|uniref:Uncharacterized protein n=1 Tax=Mytilus galloprovincialis TaxID=29158 RepID=A0A8B6CLM6_MYTGA|nr:Hypothetical predicted protein [Mytilus galloprovincialis]